MSNTSLEKLETQINNLLLSCQHLQKENAQLREKDAKIAGEYEQLFQKNQLASKKLKLMLAKLQNLENPS